MNRFLLLLGIVLLFSCSDQMGVEQRLYLAENHKNTPDSIAHLIHGLDTTNLPKKLKADYNRLYAYTQLFSASTTLGRVSFDQPINYYKRNDELNKAYETYLIAGRYWLLKKKFSEALRYLKEGYLLAKKNNDKKIIDQFCELIGGTHMESKGYDQAITYFKQRLLFNKDNQASIYYDLALNYAYKGELDSVNFFMNKSFLYSGKVPTDLFNHRVRNYADILYEKKLYRKSIEQLDQIKNCPDSVVLANLYTSYALSYSALDQIDSATLYLDRAKSVLGSMKGKEYTKYLSYKNVIMTLDAVLNTKRRQHISMFQIGQFNDSIVFENYNKQRIIRKQLSDKIRLETDILKLKIQRQQTYLTGGVVLIIVIIVFVLFISYNRKKSLLLIEEEEKRETLQRLLDDTLNEKTLNKDENFFRKILLQQLGIIKLIATKPTTQNQELLQQMTRISNSDIKVDSLLIWDDLYPIIDTVYNGFYTKAYSKYGELLNEKELQLCCLLCAEFSTKEISVITQQSVRTIYQRKSSVRKKIKAGEKGDIVRFLVASNQHSQ
ncbi:hypothetical protein FUAX_41140 (plasmid) [Fulvitalea axinellae]|uniref:HTH luxR-type domain-containing protein n=1 Tax=Fulvitalea axinellae TaxID=1182444 RepID=A0AAU9CUK9_9BACT|nr:hypothetical protein FUAX_41140 [Fulvitalea axinellae]